MQVYIAPPQGSQTKKSPGTTPALGSQPVRAKITEFRSPVVGQQHDEWAPTCADDPRPLIPSGDYLCFCTGGKKFYHPMFKREVAVLHFQPIDGPFVGTPLERFFAVSKRFDRKLKRMREYVGRNSIYLREWTIANQDQPPRRRDRMPLSKFFGKVFLVRVETIEKAWDGRVHPASLRYSKVSAILSLEVTDEPIQSDRASLQPSASESLITPKADNRGVRVEN